jgi:outer membrane protein TolC
MSLKYFIVLGLLILSKFGLEGQSLDSLESIKNYALENSTEYKRVLLDVAIARNQLDGILNLDETSFSLSTAADEDEDWTSTAAVSLPLIDQLGLSGSVSDDSSGSLGLSFSPLTHSDSREQLQINYDVALLLAEETAILTENKALTAVLNWMSYSQQLAVQEEIVTVKETVYRDQKIRYEAGEATLDDVRDDLVDWTEARTDLSNMQVLLRAGESELLQTLGTSLDAAGIEIISTEDLMNDLENLKKSITPESANPSSVYDVTSSYKNVERSEHTLSNTWLFDPEVNMTGGITIPLGSSSLSSDTLEWEAGIEFVFSLDDWQGKEKELNRQDLELTRLESKQAEMESRLNLQQVLITLETSQQNSTLAELEMEQSRELYDEALFLQEAGEYSSAETEDARLLYEQARVNYFDMLAEEYMAWRALMPYL